jgi:hypothetical protein
MRFLLCAVWILLVLSSCSTINTAYYALPQREFLSSKECKTRSVDDATVPCARLNIDGIEVIYWAQTSYHPTMRGPCLLPVYPVDAPILDSHDVRLFWYVLLPDHLKKNPAAVSIRGSSIMVTVNHGRVDKPTGLTIYRLEGGSEHIENYLSLQTDREPVPEKLEIKTDAMLELWYNTIFYSEVSSFSVQPSFLVNGKQIEGPRIEFSPEKDRRYSPYEFPFMLAPVR